MFDHFVELALKESNIQPLKSVSVDPNDSKVLKPNHIIIGRQPLMFSFIIDDKLKGTKLWKAIEALSNMFCRQLLREYVPLLNAHSLKLSDLVLLKYDVITCTSD